MILSDSATREGLEAMLGMVAANSVLGQKDRPSCAPG